MNKRLIAILVIAAIVPAMAFASILQIGPSVTYNKMVFNGEGDASGLKDISNYGFGADVRLNVYFLQVDAIGTYSKGADNSHIISTTPTANLLLKLGPIDLTAGIGPKLDFKRDSAGKWTMNGQDIYNFGDSFMHAKLAYRAGVTANMGLIGLGVSYTVPTEGTFSNFKAMPDFKSGTFGVSVLFNLF